MDRQYGRSIQPTTYRRSESITRPIINGARTGTVAALAKSIQTGNMNISTTNSYQPRTTNRLEQRSSDRLLQRAPVSVTRIRNPSVNSSSTTITNGTIANQTDYRSSKPTATMYRLGTPLYVNTEKDYSPTTSKYSSTERRSSTTNNESESARSGLTGLQNLGNTCFMNSVLQCLSNTKPLLEFCLQDNLEDHLNTSNTSVMKGALMREYANLIRKMWSTSSNRTIVSPLAFKNTIAKFAPVFTGYSEQDSQEFLRYLLQGLHEDVNKIQQKPSSISIDEKSEEQMKEKDRAKLSWSRCLRYDNSRLVDIFAGQLKSTLECSYCHYPSITFDMFWDLSIPLPNNKSSTTLQECLQLFMSKEELNGDEEPMCARCKKKRPCTKKFSIQKCPEILVLHLKRFSQSRGRNKLNTFVDFPLRNLKLNDLSDVISSSYEGTVPSYNLFGISNHSGTLYSGHYIAHCKHPFTNEWYEFNDTSVHRLNDESRIVSANAYVLFYEKQKF